MNLEQSNFRQLFRGEIVKLTFSAAILFGLAVAMFQATPALSQTKPGSIFKVVATPNENQGNNALVAASASSPKDIWAVGESTIHFDGTKWTAFPAPFIDGVENFLTGVVDVSPTLAWAVGNVIGGNPGQVIERWDGKEWSVFPGPNFPPNSQAALFGMASTSANDIWAVGSLDTDVAGFNLFEHRDGTPWTATTIQQPPAGEALLGVSADATNDAWAVGFKGANGQTFAMHWNGSEWADVATPNVSKGMNRLEAVLALSPNNAWAVGYSTPANADREPKRTLILHWDGKSWKVVPSPNVGPKTHSPSNRLSGLAANSVNDIWAFGCHFAVDGSGQFRTLVLHWDGKSWKLSPVPIPPRVSWVTFCFPELSRRQAMSGSSDPSTKRPMRRLLPSILRQEISLSC
jgi:hypothetical protein